MVLLLKCYLKFAGITLAKGDTRWTHGMPKLRLAIMSCGASHLEFIVAGGQGFNRLKKTTSDFCGACGFKTPASLQNARSLTGIV
jgi:hypothetical protein